MAWKVVVDFDRCESNSVCMGIAPEVFEVRDDNFLYILQENPPDDLRPKVEALPYWLFGGRDIANRLVCGLR